MNEPVIGQESQSPQSSPRIILPDGVDREPEFLDGFRNGVETVKAKIRAFPLEAVSIAAGAGFLLALGMFKR